MILTITPNSTIDYTLQVAAFSKDTTMRAQQTAVSMGGKPTDASFILGALGIPSLALGFVAGIHGQRMLSLLQSRGVTTDFIEVGGETRLNVIILDGSDKTSSTITAATLEVTDHHVAQLLERADQALPNASVLVTGGTLPRGMSAEFYPKLIQLAHWHNVPVIFDASEPFLSQGLAARPAYIKPNRDELSALIGVTIKSVEEAHQAAKTLYARYGCTPIVTMGSEGALAVLPERAYRIPPLPVEVVSPAGAGDAVLAGLAASITRKQPIEEGLRLGIAAAAAVCLRMGTADCRREDVERLLPQVQLIPLEN